jgi:hypothetical protein
MSRSSDIQGWFGGKEFFDCRTLETSGRNELCAIRGPAWGRSYSLFARADQVKEASA